MKQPTEKLMKNLGHNNPPVNPKSIDFTNSAIEKLKVDNLDFSWLLFNSGLYWVAFGLYRCRNS